MASKEGEQKGDKSAQPSLGEGLKTRLASAALLIPLSLALVYVGGWPFAISLILVVAAMAFEWNRLVLGSERHVNTAPYIVLYTVFMTGVLALGLQGEWGFGLLLTLLTTILIWFFAASQKLNTVWAAAGVPYLFLPMLSFIWLREDINGDHGLVTIVWLLLVVWGSDTGGYLAGKSIGGPKLAPRISPQKTWSGFAGGVALAMVAGVVVGLWVGEGSVSSLVVVSAVLSAISQVGDLVESSVKRHFGVKDFSSLIPGHGGVFDRFDGLLFVLLAAGLLKVWHGGPMVIWAAL